MQKWMIKLLPVLLAVVLVAGSCILPWNSLEVNAAEYPVVASGYDIVNFPYKDDLLTYSIVCSESTTGYVYLYTSDNEFYVNDSGTKIVCTSVKRYTNSKGISSNFWSNSISYNSASIALSNVSAFLYTSHDISNSSDEVFFYALGKTALARVVQKEVTQKMTTKEIVGLLPLLIPLSVSLIGLRKGLRFISTILKAA